MNPNHSPEIPLPSDGFLLDLHGSSKSNKKPSDGRGISDYPNHCITLKSYQIGLGTLRLTI